MRKTISMPIAAFGHGFPAPVAGRERHSAREGSAHQNDDLAEARLKEAFVP